MSDLKQILKNYKLRNTPIRQAILNLFLENKVAFSHGEVEQKFLDAFDRATVYRTLKSFEEKGLIHRVIDDGAVVKYALCDANCAEHDHQDNHVHFKCEICQQTFCLHNIPIEKLAMPDGFQANDYELLVTGICKNCQ